MNFTKIALTGGADFVPIVVTQTAIASGDTVHTAGAVLPAFDELYIYATNTDTSQRALTLAYGGTADPTNMICKTLPLAPLSGPTLVAIVNGTNGKVLKAACDVASKVVLTGFCNRAA